MPTLFIQIAPQRSTQYAALASQLAPYEVQLSLVGTSLQSVEPETVCGRPFLRCELLEPLSNDQIAELGRLGMVGLCFDYFETVDKIDGPLLRPIETGFQPAFPPDLLTTRRYRGKTNEMLTQFMCNVARFSSDFAATPWSNLRLFDPLAGGGTTLFAALMLGASAVGIEQNKKSAHSTAVFLRQYMQEQRIKHTVKEENLKKMRANRWWFELGESATRCMIARGEIIHTHALLAGFKRPHFVVADLPYGVQHKGGLQDLLLDALPIWAELLLPGGALVYSWESTRFSRAQMIEMIKSETELAVFEDPPYDRLAHRVDRAIKNRDVIVAKRL